jgi:hypothetical protein
LQPHHQREPRYDAEWPVQMQPTGSGTTRNLSATGLFIEMDTAAAPGDTVSLIVDLDVAGRKMQWVCQARVVRTEQRNGKVGMGAQVLQQQLVDLC